MGRIGCVRGYPTRPDQTGVEVDARECRRGVAGQFKYLCPGDNNCRSRQRKAMSKRIPFHDGLAVRWQRLKILMGWFTVTDTLEFRVVC